MKKIKRFCLFAGLLVIVSCAKEYERIDNNELIPLQISSSINQETSKATSDGFVDGDAIGLFAVNYSDDNAVAGSLTAKGNQADNVKYIFDEESQKWMSEKACISKIRTQQ